MGRVGLTVELAAKDEVVGLLAIGAVGTCLRAVGLVSFFIDMLASYVGSSNAMRV